MLGHNAAMERLARRGNDSRNATALCEHHFQLLQATAHGLGVAKVYDGEDERGDDEENEVVLPANGFDRDLMRCVSKVQNPRSQNRDNLQE